MRARRAPGPAGEVGRQVLCVEDEKFLSRFSKICLEWAGYHCTKAQDGVTGLEIIRETPAGFDLIWTDYNMPRMNGLVLVRKSRDAGFRGDVIV